jgi:outer membrane protein
MKTKEKIILNVLLFFLGSQLSAQETWSLNDCIKFAIKNNLELHAANLGEQIAEQNYQQSKWSILPGIGAQADAGRNYGRSVDPNTNGIINTSFFNNSYGIGASLDVFRGFMTQNQIGYEKFKKEAATNYRDNATDDLAFEVMNALFVVIYQQEMLKIANEQKEISELNVKKFEIMVTTGVRSQAELLEVKANLEKDQLECIRTKNNIESAWIRLKKAMNLPPNQEIKLAAPEDDAVVANEISTDVNELFKVFSQQSPYIQMYENDWKASRKSVGVQKAGYFPTIRFQASYNTGYYETNKDENQQTIAFNEQIKNNQNQWVGASMNIPIFNRNAVRFEVKKSKLALEQAEANLNQSKQNLLYEMEKNYSDLNASFQEFQQSEKQLEADQLAFQAAQKKFDQGMTSAIEFYTVKNRLTSTTNQLLISKLMLGVKKRTMDFYKGVRFWE